MAGVDGWVIHPIPTQHRIGDPFITFIQLFPNLFIPIYPGLPGFKRPVANPFAVEAEDPGWGFWPFSPEPGSIGQPLWAGEKLAGQV